MMMEKFLAVNQKTRRTSRGRMIWSRTQEAAAPTKGGRKTANMMNAISCIDFFISIKLKIYLVKNRIV